MNNFDQSSTGINLELSCFRDCSKAQLDFKESFRVLQHESNRKNAIFVYTEFGNVSGDFEFHDWNQYTFTKADLASWLADIDHLDNLRDRSQYLFSKSYSKLTKAELQELIEHYIQYDLGEEMKEKLTPTFDVIVTRGYCQGDYAEVILTKEYKDWVLSQGGSLEGISETIDHLCWDVPIYCRLTVNGDREFYLDEYIDSRYDFDKDELIKQFEIVQKDLFSTTDANNFESLEQIQYVVDWLKSNMPECPEHHS